MKILRRLGKILTAIAIVIVVLIICLFVFINPIVKKTVTTLGPKLLGVPVELKVVSISPFYGKVQLKGLRISNPEGFSERPLIVVGDFLLDLDTWSLFGNKTIIVNKVSIRDLAVSYEVVSSLSNVDALQKGMPKKNKTVAEAPPTKPARKVVIECFECRGGHVSYSAAFTARKAVTLSLPDIEIHDIGKAFDGVTPVEATKRILGEIASSVGKTVTDVSGSVVNSGGKLLEGTGRAVGSGLNTIGNGVKGLFK